MESKITKFREHQSKIAAYNYCLWIMGFDQETETPELGLEFQSKNFAVLIEEAYKLEMDPEYLNLVDDLFAEKNNLDEELRVEIEHIHKGLRLVRLVPKNEYLDFQILIQSASTVWVNAKKTNNFSLFEPVLEKIVDFSKKIIKYLETDELKGYDVLLDLYEPNMTTKEYDAFFGLLKSDLVPFVLEKTKKPVTNKKLAKKTFDIDAQKKFSNYLMDVLGYDRKRGVLKESAHPFTSGLASVDTRITTHYHEDSILSNIFSVIHESGHAIYEQQNDPRYDGTPLHGGASMGVHESQSRLYENMIGRSYSFWATHYGKLQELFSKQFKNITVDEFYAFANEAKRSLIRIEADELTYSLHIMVRYELEKGLMSGKIKVKDLPKKWNQLIYQYLHVRPKTDSEGVLQDIHWSGGSFGYFPTYALGSAYAAQIYAKMDKDININKQIEANNIKGINEWLKNHIHKYGELKSPKEIMLLATGEPFDPKYYVDYLINKFSKL